MGGFNHGWYAKGQMSSSISPLMFSSPSSNSTTAYSPGSSGFSGQTLYKFPCNCC